MRFKIRSWVALVMLWLIGCASSNLSGESQTAVPLRATIAPQLTLTVHPSVVPSVSAPTPRPQQIQPAPATATLTLKVISPVDESIVDSAEITISGTVTLNAVVSVNGLLAQVDQTGKFHIQLKLKEGPNLIEVVASDAYGNQADALLIVIYEP